VTHSEVRALFNDYLEGDLDRAERARVEAHLPECRSCSEELRELRETVSLLRGLPESEPPSDLAETVMARVAAGEGQDPIALRAFRRLSEPRYMPLAAALTGIAIFFGLQAVPLGGRAPAERAPGGVVLRVPDAAPVAELPRSPAIRVPEVPSGVGSAFAGANPGLLLPDLDHALQLLRTDPAALLDQLQTFSEGERERSYQQLVERARHRGDAAEYASRLRTSRHRLAPGLAARFAVPARSIESPPIEVDLSSAERASR
jgi:hypothetical protein